MRNGISIYFGLDNTLEENLQLLHNAATSGIRRVFTSLHIPEADYARLKSESRVILSTAASLDMEIISDISPQTLELLQLPAFSLAAFEKLGIRTLRLDYGYTPQEVASLSRNQVGLRIQLNASSITVEFLAALEKEKTNFANLDALHNFYPRAGSGIAENFFRQKNALLRSYNLQAGAFIPSQNRRRSPLREGLPTLEAHREISVDLASRHLAAMGIDAIFIGDALPSTQELDQLAATKPNQTAVRIDLLTTNPGAIRLLRHTLTARQDEARDAIRAEESRALLKAANAQLLPENTAARPPGVVTLDNEGYQRYMGELQIIKRTQPQDKRVNVVAAIQPEEEFLLPYILPGTKFCFLF